MPKENVLDGVQYIKVKDIKGGKINLSGLHRTTKAIASKYKRSSLKPGDLLLSIRGTYGRVATVPVVLDGANITQDTARLAVVLEVESWYVVYHLLSSETQNYFKKVARGVAVKGVNIGDVKLTPIALAPLIEQRRIVAAIEANLTRLDAGVAGLEKVRAKLKRYRAAVLKAACEGRLVPTEAELAHAEGRTYEPADRLLTRILQTRREHWEAEEVAKIYALGKHPKGELWKARYVNPTPLKSDDLPSIPDGWCWTSLDSLIATGPQNGLYLPKELYGSGHPILRIDDFQDVMSRSSVELRRVKVDAEIVHIYGLRLSDLVINRVNSPSHLGKCLIVAERNLPALFESNMMRIGLSGLVNGAYVAIYLRSRFGRKRLTKNAKWAVNQASINQTDVSETAVPLPPVAEQRRIAIEVERRLSLIDELDAAASASLKRAERLRQSILKRAFEGKLVPQDPADEPAEALLARIHRRGKVGTLFDGMSI